MLKLLTTQFWASLARIILRNKIVILVLIIGATIGLSSYYKNLRFTFSEANLLPDDHEVNQKYNRFLEIFGEEGNLILIGTKDENIFQKDKLNAWKNLSDELKNAPEVSEVIAVTDLKKLVKNSAKRKFELENFYPDKLKKQSAIDSITIDLFNNYPFYDKFLFNKNTKAVRTAIYLKKEIVNTKARKLFIMNNLMPKLDRFEEVNNLDIKISGMPYIRTLNSKNIVDEMNLFIIAALFTTSLIFFLFFRSFRATFISLIVVCFGVIWSVGIIGVLNYEITVLTALIPPLIIVIGIPNCIFLINKYQHEVKLHGNKIKSLQRVITKVGNATLMTNITTASGFATFILTDSKLLKEFGLVASLSIIAIFILCLLIIPIIYTFLPYPKERHLKHLNTVWITKFVSWMENMVKNNRVAIYGFSVVLLIVSIIGVYKIKVSGNLLEDLSKSSGFYKDIKFFEEEFHGVLPLEILIDTKTANGINKLSTLKRMNELENFIGSFKELSQPVSLVSLIKYTKQAYYNNKAEYYQLPSSQEKNFILSYVKNSTSKDQNLLKDFVDKTGRYARITTFMVEMETDKMVEIEEKLNYEITRLFPNSKYEVTVTGKPIVYQKGTDYLINNLVVSLTLAILLISLFMAYMFRSFKMIIVSLIPNLLPLLITAGLMGYLGIPIKPSTILVFSIAFGISVDDTIHFLAKYRQELIANKWKVKKSVYGALRETGVSMFYTSIVLFFGFSVFTISSFGGTVALGALVSVTLLFAMLANLLVLPSLLLSLEKIIANKKVLKKPSIDIIPEEEE